MRAYHLSLIASLSLTAPHATAEILPPVANKAPVNHTIHGETRTDNYHWLREKTNPEVIAYLDAENAYTAEMMKDTGALQETLYKEIVSHIKETDLTVPYRWGSFYYYSRTEQGKQYAIYCRKPAGKDLAPPDESVPEEIVLEVNELAAGHKFMGIGAYSMSDDNTRLLYSTDTTGFRQYTLHVKDLTTGKTLPDTIEKVVLAFWGGDDRTIYYVVEDHAKRPYRLYRRTLGSTGQDELLYEEKDELYRLYAYRSNDKRIIFAVSESSETTEVRYMPSADVKSQPVVILPRRIDHEYYVEHRDGLLYIRTNDGAKDFRIVTAPLSDPSKWKELVPARAGVRIEGAAIFSGHLVLQERESGLDQINVVDLKSGEQHRVKFPEETYSVWPDANLEFETTSFRYRYQSFKTPSSVFQYDLAKRTSTLLKQTEVPGGFDASAYVSERLSAVARDGTTVPVSIVYRKGLLKDGNAPMHLYAYGSYGASMPVSFNPARLCMLDRGFVMALAHIRGGGEMGEHWHDQGKMLSKKNTFTDFIDVAEHLIREKYTSSDRLVIQGGSAGGLLMGAVTNMRPDLFKAVVTNVPFVDVINTMLDASLPLTVQEYLEWGNPNVKADYEYMKSYCPYTNIQAKRYPAMLVTTSLNDSQVMYWEPAKYVAKLRATKQGGEILLLKTNMGAGHGGASGRYDAWRERAFEYAFILTQVGITK